MRRGGFVRRGGLSNSNESFSALLFFQSTLFLKDINDKKKEREKGKGIKKEKKRKEKKRKEKKKGICRP